MANTGAMISNNTNAYGTQESDRTYLQEDILFDGKTDKYEIYSKQRIGIGGESLVYKAKRMSDGEEVAAKIYDKYNPNDAASKKNRKIIIEFLNKNMNYHETHIMPLYDHGFISLNIDDHIYELPIDIMPLCKEDSLLNKQIDYNRLKQNIIPSIIKAVNLLHNENLVHRDIKPNNLYLFNNVVVLADFGTTSQILKDNNTGMTQAKRGTPGYRAPEIWGGFFEKNADYYSLGCTIAALYKGEHVYQRILDSGNESELNASMSKGLPLDCPEKEADLQCLVNSLILLDSKERACYDDLLSWIEDPKSYQKKWQPKLDKGFSAASAVSEIKIKERVCRNKAEITDAMLEDWEFAKRIFYSGGEKNSAIVNYLSKEDQNLSLKAIEIIEENRETINNQDLGLARFLHFFNTNDGKPCQIYWNGMTYKNLEEISEAMFKSKVSNDIITKMLKDKFLSWKFKNTQGTNNNTINAIQETEDIAAIYPMLGYFTFMYRFASEENKIKNSTDGLFNEITRDKSNWFTSAEKLIKDDAFLAKLIILGYKENVLHFKKECNGKYITEDNNSDLLLFYQLFEGVCENKISVREHFLKYGPLSFLYWFRQNINLYSFNSYNAREIEKKIKSLKVDSNMNIVEIMRAFLALKQYLNDFKNMFQNNYLITYIGLRTEQETTGITTNNSYAYFTGNFFGITVPVGYLRSLAN